jgi:hypothetical protein
MFYPIERAAWLDFMGAPPEYVRAVSEAARWLAGELAKSRGRWIRRGYEKIATPQERLHIVSSADDLFNRSAAEWEDIEISFLGYDTVRIQIGQAFRNRNYAELGFEDRRSEKPNRAWRVLMALAEPRSDTKCIGRTEMTWPQEERRFQEIRKVFRKYFGLDGDPLPYVRGSGYRVRFRIRCAESFR